MEDLSNDLRSKLTKYGIIKGGTFVASNQLILKIDFNDDYIHKIYGRRFIDKLKYSGSYIELLSENDFLSLMEIILKALELHYKIKKITIKQYSYCNRKWVLIEGSNLDQIVQDGGANSENKIIIKPGDANSEPKVVIKPGEASDHIIISAAYNSLFTISDDTPIYADFSEQISEDNLQRVHISSSARISKPIIAIADTGFDHHFFEEQNQPSASEIIFPLYFNRTGNKCSHFIPEYIGWNFVDNNNSPFDTNPNKHGTKIAAIIAKTANANDIQIMPLKTHNSDGIAKGFDIICALVFAERHGVSVVNASWGTYIHDIYNKGLDSWMLDDFLVMLRNQMQSMPNVLFVTAAGNAVDIINNTPANLDTIEGPQTGKKYHFYPASFNLPNQITVTTVWYNKQIEDEGRPAALQSEIREIKPVEHFSPNLVHVGVIAYAYDRLNSYPTSFNNSLSQNDWNEYLERRARQGLTGDGLSYQTHIRGSSFSCAIVSSMAIRTPILGPRLNKNMLLRSIGTEYPINAIEPYGHPTQNVLINPGDIAL